MLRSQRQEHIGLAIGCFPPEWLLLTTRPAHCYRLQRSKAALCLAGAAGLRHLNVSSNLFSGAVPASWANFSRLQTVNMNHNALSGTVPAFLLAMPALTSLSMVNNTLRGTLPPSPGALPAC